MQRAGRFGIIATLVGLLLMLKISSEAGQTVHADPQPIMSVGFALATGGFGDHAFNDGAYARLQRAQHVYNTRFRVVEWKGNAAQAANLRDLA